MALNTLRQCYHPDGSPQNDAAYLPCSNDTSRPSVCCGTNHQAVGHLHVADDLCDPNGLCLNFDGDEKLWWRGSCTDSSWQSEYCLPQVCTFGAWQDENAPVRRCGENSWCCGDPDCCTESSSTFALAATLRPEISSSSIGPVTLSTTGSASITSTSTRSTSDISAAELGSSSDGLSKGVQAGIGVGAAVGAILLVIIGLLVIKLRKRRDAGKKTILIHEYNGGQEKQVDKLPRYVGPPAELHGVQLPAELGEFGPAELESR